MAQNLWYKDAIFYAIDIPSSQDSNGDGIGDFPGATGPGWTIWPISAGERSG